ncbi:hypothetical protein CROQUDRAFT_48208 [Cronartium quercuum f. sp. fusiforme G11]|uniref:Uncharacterized protein n=1 Tax=Cronartium quercuum f. sp. fusiforme G11 TaxID=708437 RepID=A0A9P6T9Q2_9BASI|nr:hypothetical protein CROQUDRAFT_48208 [Cronartium quercuum f. sp. fusiforme G11]
MWFNPLRLKLISILTSNPIPISKLRYRSIWLPRSDLSQDNIFAPATPTNTKSALSIIRVNGPDASNLYKLMTCSTKTKPIKDLNDDIQIPNRTIKLRKVFCHQTFNILDPEAIVMNFPHSNLTSTFEFHLHGSKSIIKSVIESLSKLPKFRIAKPGEFTLRRFERSNELELNRLLGIKNLIDAETEEQRKMAIHQFESGQFSKIYQNLRKNLLDCMSLCEVILDFSEDGSIDDKLIWNQIRLKIEYLKSIIINHLKDSQRHEKVINGIRISLFGSPNVGKSTLLNWIGKEASIVSPYPGTTRDIVEVSIDFHGFPLILYDTAGLRETEDPVEDIGISRAQAK